MKYLLQFQVVSLSILVLGPLQTHQLDDGRNRHDYCYDEPDCRPSTWDGTCKTGKGQSPIDLVPQGSPKPVDLNFNRNYKADEFTIINSGKTIQVNLLSRSSSVAQISGYEFEKPYSLAQIHFHWGATKSSGSEHSVNGTQYAMEVHFVHYDTKYKNFTDAIDSGDKKGLAVLAVFLKEGSRADKNSAFDLIAEEMPKTYKPKGWQIRKSIRLSPLLPKAGEKFFRYFGSLTSPGCTEAVEWTVMEQPIYVKPKNVEKFRKIMEAKGRKHHKLMKNVRPVQPLNGRVVQYLVKN